MSIELMSQAYKKQLEARLQRVLLVLCDHADDRGQCWPSVSYTAWKLGCDEKTVRRALLDLRDKGVITVKVRPGTSRLYTIHLEALKDKEPYVQPGGQNVRSKLDDRVDKMSGGSGQNVRSEVDKMSGKPPMNHQGTTNTGTSSRKSPGEGWNPGQLQALVRAYAAGMGMAVADLSPSLKGKATNAFKNLPVRDLAEAVEDVRGCTQYLMNTAKWRSSIQNRAPGAVVDAVPVWVNEGRPEAPPPLGKERGNDALARILAQADEDRRNGT